MLAAMSNAFEGPIALTVGRSRRLLAVIVTGHLACICMLFTVPVNSGWLVAGAAAMASIGAWEAFGYWRAYSCDIVSLLWRPDDSWILGTRGGVLIRARLKHAFPLNPTLVVLKFEPYNGRRLQVALLPDNVDHDQLRRLRVRLSLPPENSSRLRFADGN